ncbi:MAG: SMC-Scp complex subunit ScpB [Ignavibacteriales bacterium]|nr:SMC-Scp complex subunit ScpB [Ignavibacterium sp.]MCZ2267702.1 SMC-Scp complex subunit ScpB [Ignavibacteriales bacterium]MCZ7611191.1 SMC-Scp complex subunit ScpB [Ignavibacterium sp.]MEB2355678.1 SMC-Scp complex subunit ScpB [Ignavibacteriales bacterium]GIK22858.1 MAG: segregation and condensation protein B [Ignavibacteriota bacterium]
MDKSYSSIIEVLIFSSDEPISESEIIRAIKGIDGEDIEISSENISDTVDLLNKSYEDSSRSFRIKKIANGFVFVTSEIFAKYVGYLSSEKSKRRLSQAALETLAIIAYKQPVTKPELEQIRGVNSDYILTTLLEKNLITITGRAESIGRPLLYGTTTEFLKYFGLYNLSDLPKPREIEEIMKDEDFIEQKNKIMMNFVEESLEKEISEDKNDDPAE